jgi:ABC-type polysaccharide/polyol phosphate transport system ATPase subunit
MLEARNISKRYRIYRKPSDRLKELVFRRRYHDEFVALKNISFSVPFRQTLGIVGDNGAGKSTLLKILAGTLSPSEGEVIRQGRVAALLELGAGFHPEFTGRQNIFLNAGLLGLNEQEIREREQSIIDFAELEEFIDRPVKTYSSGMYVRLAFSIATSVDPDILIVDEALSVGDQRFQKKCIDRMVKFRDSGRIIIFCSHSMYHIDVMCDRAMWIENGEIQMLDNASDVIRAYETSVQKRQKIYREESAEIATPAVANNAPCIIRRVWIEDGDGNEITEFEPFTDIVLKMKLDILDESVQTHFGFAIVRSDELICFGSLTTYDGLEASDLAAGMEVSVSLSLSALSLLDGEYRVVGGITDEHGLHLHHVKYSDPFLIKSRHEGLGVVSFRRKWEISCQ